MLPCYGGDLKRKVCYNFYFRLGHSLSADHQRHKDRGRGRKKNFARFSVSWAQQYWLTFVVYVHSWGQRCFFFPMLSKCVGWNFHRNFNILTEYSRLVMHVLNKLGNNESILLENCKCADLQHRCLLRSVACGVGNESERGLWKQEGNRGKFLAFQPNEKNSKKNCIITMEALAVLKEYPRLLRWEFNLHDE